MNVMLLWTVLRATISPLCDAAGYGQVSLQEQLSMTDQSNEVTESFYRCRRDGHFVDTFYDLFLSKSTEIAQKFLRTDFRIQKLMLRQSLLEMICFDRGMPGTREEIERLGRSHKELRIAPDMYSMWLDALCEAIRKHDPDYTPELEQLWRHAMLKSINEMISAGGSQESSGC
jgi:hemoglobin-like flavoprotein